MNPPCHSRTHGEGAPESIVSSEEDVDFWKMYIWVYMAIQITVLCTHMLGTEEVD